MLDLGAPTDLPTAPPKQQVQTARTRNAEATGLWKRGFAEHSKVCRMVQIVFWACA